MMMMMMMMMTIQSCISYCIR